MKKNLKNISQGRDAGNKKHSGLRAAKSVFYSFDSFIAFINYSQWFLAFIRNSPKTQFITQALFISRFKQPEANLLVYFYCCTGDIAG
jgi:hypothetical protein